MVGVGEVVGGGEVLVDREVVGGGQVVGNFSNSNAHFHQGSKIHKFTH